jgi:hypothetical protein
MAGPERVASLLVTRWVVVLKREGLEGGRQRTGSLWGGNSPTPWQQSKNLEQTCQLFPRRLQDTPTPPYPLSLLPKKGEALLESHGACLPGPSPAFLHQGHFVLALPSL